MMSRGDLIRNACLMLSMLIAAGCQSAPSTQHGMANPAHDSIVPLISPRELVRRVQAGENIVFLDVREPQEYAENHIPGAINVPQREFRARQSEIDPSALVIPYCNMDFRGFYAVKELREMGISNVMLMQERGILGWQGVGLPVAGGPERSSDTEAQRQLMSIDPSQLATLQEVNRVPSTGRTRHIRIHAANWHFDPNDLTVTAGDQIHLILQSEEGDHYFVQPDYEIGVLIREGETRELAFTADQPGEFRFGSCEWDGTDLQVMKGRLRVQEEER